MKAIIVAGGKGTRIRPYTDFVPKPMLLVSGKPILEHIILFLKKNNIRDLLITICHLPRVITSYFGSGERFGVTIQYIYEPVDKPRGTAGSFLYAKESLHETFIVTYADIIRELKISDVIEEHKGHHAFATIVVYKNFQPDPKSSVEFNSKGMVTNFIERPKILNIHKNNNVVWSNGSFYVFEPEILDFIPQGRSSDFGKDIFRNILSAGKRMYAYPQRGYFIDIGNIQKLAQANNNSVGNHK